MKKIISMFLIVSLIASLMMAPMSAFASSEDFLVAESFNDQPTGAVPLNGAVASGNAKIKVTKEGKEKAVELSGAAIDSTLYYPVTTSAKIASMFVELKFVNDVCATEFYVYNKDGKSFLLAYIDKDGTVCSGDARLASGFPKNRETGVQLVYNAKRKKVSIYMGNKCLMANRYLGEAAYDHIAGFGLKVKGSPDTSCYADNFAIFEGQSHIKSKDVPKKGFNSESVLPDEEVTSGGEIATTDEFVGDTVYVNRTFDETDIPEYEKITRNFKKNKIEIDTSVFDGNKYLKLEKKEAEESFIAFGANQTARYVVMEVDLSTDNHPPVGTIKVRDGEASQMFGTFINYATNGDVTTTDGRLIGKIEPRKWLKLGLAFNMNDLSMNIYANGELVYKDVPFVNKNLTGLPLLRIYCDKKANTGTLLVDNIKTYEGKEPRELGVTERRSKVTPDSVSQGYLGMNKAINPFASTYYTDKVKYDAEHKMLLENDNTVVYAHEDELKKLFGSSALLENPHATEAGYYNALETAKANGYMIKNIDTRLYIFSRTPVELTDARIAEVQRYMFNVRPTRDELWELYKKSDNYQKHPRVMIDAEKLEEIKALYKTDPLMQKWGANVIARADEIMGEDDYTYPITGSSMDEVNYSMDDIVNLCLAYHLTGNERYVGRTWRFIKNVCDLLTWNPYGYLDVGELSFITAIGYDWLYDKWTDEQRKYMEKAIYEKGTELTHRLYYGELDGKTFLCNDGLIKEYYTGWWDSENNWNAVCNGGVMCGAMAIMDVYPEIAMSAIENTNRALEYITANYYPDGAWEEGGGYWRYALGYIVRVINTLRNVFGTDFRLLQSPGLSGTGWYGSRLAGSTGQYTIGDTSGGNIDNPHIMWCASEYRDAGLMAMRLQELESFGIKGGADEMLYYDSSLYEGNVEPALDTFMDGMEVICLREAWYDKGTTFVGASGGQNGRGHGHYDTGSFQIDMAGERFICEPGAENYGAPGGYFTANRYRFYRSRPEGHNMYIINPENENQDYYGVVPGSRAEGELVVSKPRGAIAKMDMSEIYGNWVSKATRGYMLSDDRRSVTVRDEIDLLQPNSEIYYSIHTKAKIEKLNDKQMVLTLNGKKMLITLETNGEDVVFEEAKAATISTINPTIVKDTDNTSQGLRKMVIKMKGTGRINITLKFKQYDDMMVADEPPSGDIDTWTIPDGEVTPLPSVDAIYLDGEPVDGFDPKVTGYSKNIRSEAETAPVVTVDTNHRYEIIPTPTPEGDTLVKVYADGRDDVYRTYRLNFWKKPPLKDVDGMRRYPIYEATCIDSYELKSPPDNAYDMDAGTRWAAESTNLIPETWIMFELDDEYPIEKIGVSWMSATARQYTYKLEISTDGKNWKTVFDGVSSGTTAECEYTQLGGQRARYVRYKGYGNTVNGWNSVTEIQILGNQR